MELEDMIRTYDMMQMLNHLALNNIFLCEDKMQGWDQAEFNDVKRLVREYCKTSREQSERAFRRN